MRLPILAVGGIVLLCVVPGLAHHSYADFHDHVVSIEGTLEKVVFANPHTILTVRGKDAVYTGNWRAAFQLNTMGVKPTDLNRTLRAWNPAVRLKPDTTSVESHGAAEAGHDERGIPRSG
jgi:Family of unknown function (DUF6152)